MKRLFKYYSKLKKELKFLFYISLATYFLIEIVFNNYDEIFAGAYKVGVFFCDISISYISSFIFYFIVVHIKNEEDKKNVNELVGQEIYKIITAGHLLIQPFQQKFDKNARYEHLSREELRKLLRSIKKGEKESPLTSNGEVATWLEWFEYLKAEAERSFQIINLRYSLIDSDLVKILSRIENSIFFYQFQLLYNDTIGDTFFMFETQIFTYLNLIKELEEYAEKNLADYKYMKADFVGLYD